MATEAKDDRASAHALPRRTEYTALRRIDWWIVPLLAEAIAKHIEAAKPAEGSVRSCLDVGCGGQPLRSQLTNVGFRYTSLDVQQNAAGTVDFVAQIDRSLPAALLQRRFDFIVCTEVLEHVADWPAAFANLTQLLAPGGRLLLTCPHIWVPHEEPFDFHRPTNWGIAHHGARAGLKEIEITRLGDGYDVLGTVLAAVRMKVPKGRPWMWLLAGPAMLVRKITLILLNKRWMKGIVELRTGLYLDTLALFEKPRE